MLGIYKTNESGIFPGPKKNFAGSDRQKLRKNPNRSVTWTWEGCEKALEAEGLRHSAQSKPVQRAGLHHAVSDMKQTGKAGLPGFVRRRHVLS